MCPARPQLVTGEIYHIVNRAIEGKKLFQEVSDYFRFIFSLYEFNNKNMVIMRTRAQQRKERKYIGSTYAICGEKRELLIEILAFCLMPNHYHLVIRQLVENGISIFLQKLGDGYVGYFNEKYYRKGRGSIFQGRPKIVPVETNQQFMNLICYVFTNPTELIERNWKEEGIKNPSKAIEFVKSYRWSSYLDCIGKDNFPSVTKREFLFEVFGDPQNIKNNVQGWILHKAELNKGLEAIKGLRLE
jgi:putative transposase